MDVSIERPRFRSDLVAQPIEEEGVRYVDVTDPNSGATFRFYDVEYSIACAMDGARDLSALSEWTRAELGIETDIGELANVVNTLADLGYLEAARAAAQAAGNGAVASSMDEGEVSAEVEAAYDEVIAQRPALDRPAEPPPPAEPPQVKPSVDAEMSFEGLMDDERPSAKPAAPPPLPTPRPAPIAPARALDSDDEPTHIPAPAVEDDEDDAVPAIDLSAHLTVDREEVDDAVRSSRVMAAVEIPKGLDLEEEPTNVADRAAGAPPQPPEPMPLPAPPEGPRAIPLPSAPPVRAIEPTRQPQAAAVARKPQPQKSGSALWYLVFLVLLLGIAGGVYMFRDKIFGGEKFDSTAKGPAKPTKPTQGGVTPTKPVQPLSAPTAKLEEEGGSLDVSSPTEGEIGWIVADGQQVASGEALAKLEGFDKVEKARERAQKEMANAQARLDHYKSQNNAAKIAEKEGLVKAAQEAIAAADKDLANLVVTAPREGVVQLLAGKGAKVKAGDPVIRLGGDPVLVATFDVGAAAASYKLGSTCVVAAQAARDKEYACVVEIVEGDKVSVRLVPGAAAAKGDAVVLLKK